MTMLLLNIVLSTAISKPNIEDILLIVTDDLPTLDLAIIALIFFPCSVGKIKENPSQKHVFSVF